MIDTALRGDDVARVVWRRPCDGDHRGKADVPEGVPGSTPCADPDLGDHTATTADILRAIVLKSSATFRGNSQK